MCQAKSQGGMRCSAHAKKALQQAVAGGDEKLIRQAKIEYYTTTTGIEDLRKAGKNDLADRFAVRRETLIAKNRREWRRENAISVALDLDNTTADFTGAFRASLAKKYNLSSEEAMKRYPEPSDYSFVKSGWFKDMPEFLNEFHEAERKGLYQTMPIFTKARKTVQGMHSEGYQIHFVTARSQEFNEDTKHALRKYRLPYHLLKHTEDKENHNAHLFIDDAPKQISTLTLNGKKVIAYDASYNSDSEGVARVKSWDEIADAASRHTTPAEKDKC